MSASEMLTIKTTFDPSGLQEMEKKTDLTIGQVKKAFANMGKALEIKPTINSAEIKKQVGDIEKALEKINKSKDITPEIKQDEIKKQINELTKLLGQLTERRHEIEISGARTPELRQELEDIQAISKKISDGLYLQIDTSRDLQETINELRQVQKAAEDVQESALIMLKVDVNWSEMSLKEIETEIKRLNELRIEPEFKLGSANLAALEDQLNVLEMRAAKLKKPVEIPVKADAELAKKSLAEIQAELKELNEIEANIRLIKADDWEKELAEVQKTKEALREEEVLIQVETTLKVNQKELKAQIKAIDTELKDVTKRRDILLTMPKNRQVEKELEAYEKRIAELTKEKKIKLEVDKRLTKEANESLIKLAKSFGLVSAAVGTANAAFAFISVKIAGSLDHIDKASQKLGLSAQTYQELSYFASQTGTDVDRLGRSMRTLSIQAVANNSSFKALGISVKNASGELKTQEELFGEVLGALSKVPEGVARAKVANDLLGMSSQELAAAMNAGAEGFQKAAEEARKYGIIIDDDVVKTGTDASSAFNTMFKAIKALLQNAIAPILPELTKMAYSIAEFAANITPIAVEYVPKLINGLKALIPYVVGAASGFATYAAGTALAAAGSAAMGVGITGLIAKIKALTLALMKNPIGLIAVAVAGLITLLIKASQNWELFAAKAKLCMKQIWNIVLTVCDAIALKTEQFKTFVKNALLELLKFIADKFLKYISAYMGILSNIPVVGSLFESAKQKIDDMNKSIAAGIVDIQEKNKAHVQAVKDSIKVTQAARQKEIADLKDHVASLSELKDEEIAIEEEKQQQLNNIDLDAGKTDKEKDKIKALEERYAAQVLIAKATIKDEEELTAELKRIDTAYYTEKLRLMQEALEAQIIKGKELTQAQIDQYTELQEKLKEITQEQTQLEALEETYKARVEIARRTVSDEEKLEAELLELRKEYLKERLKLLLIEAEAQIAASGGMSEATRQAIEEIKALIAELEGTGQSFAQKLAAFVDTWGAYLNDMVSNLTDFFSNSYEARINSLDAALDRELRMIENALAAETAMREAQLEQYADLDERKEALAEEHEERMRDLTERQWEHLTEEEWRALEDQRQAEEQRYSESLAALEADMAARDELQLQQEIAEAEALARKEALEKEYAIKRAQMERKQAIAEKANALFSAAVNMARAIGRAFADHAFPFSAVVAGIVGAAGAAQMAAIAARPLPAIPSYFKGGEVSEANKKQYRHMPQPDNPHDNALIWARKGEWVLPLQEAAAYKKIQAMGLTLADLLRPQPQFALPDGGSVSSVTGSHNTTITQNNKYEVKDTLTPGAARRLANKQARAMARKLV